MLFFKFHIVLTFLADISLYAQISCLLNIYNMKYVTTLDMVSIALTLLATAFYLWMTLYPIFLYKRRQKQMKEDKDYELSMGIFFSGLKTDEWNGMLFLPIEMSRKWIVGFIFIILAESPDPQVISFLGMNFLFLIAMCVMRPFEAKTDNAMLIINEVCMTIVSGILVVILKTEKAEDRDTLGEIA